MAKITLKRITRTIGKKYHDLMFWTASFLSIQEAFLIMRVSCLRTGSLSTVAEKALWFQGLVMRVGVKRQRVFTG